MTLGEKILSLRKARGWSQEELADRIGVTRQAVSRWESDSAKPDADKIIAVCKEFGVSADYLLGLQPRKGPPETTGVLVDQNTAGWGLVVLSAMVIVGYGLILQLLRENLLWLLWSGIVGICTGLALGPFRRQMARQIVRRQLGIVCLVIDIAPCIYFLFYALEGTREPELALLWPAAILGIVGGALLYSTIE